MRSEISSYIDHSYVDPSWSKAARQCTGLEPVQGRIYSSSTPAGAPELVDFQSLLVRHNGPNVEYGGSKDFPIYWPAYYYLLDAGCLDTDIQKVMDPHSRLKKPLFRHVPETVPYIERALGTENEQGIPEFEYIQDVYSLSLTELQEVLEERLTPLYTLSNLSLNSEFRYGFNRHGLEDHIRVIAQRTVQLLKDLGCDEMTQKLGMIMAYGHDLGNVFTRKFHSLASPYLLEKYVPELSQNAEHWALIIQGIELHNEPVMAAFVAAQMQNGKTKDEVYKELHPTITALIAADKTHIDPARISDKAQKILDALNADDHVEINLLLKTLYAGIQEKGVYTWKMEKQRTMSTKQNDAFITLVESLPQSNCVNECITTWGQPTSGYTHEQHKKNNILHLDTLDAGIWAIYEQRVFLAIDCLLSEPQINEVRIEIMDSELDKAGQFISHVFTRENKEQKMKALREVARKERTKREEYRARMEAAKQQ